MHKQLQSGGSVVATLMPILFLWHLTKCGGDVRGIENGCLISNSLVNDALQCVYHLSMHDQPANQCSDDFEHPSTYTWKRNYPVCLDGGPRYLSTHPDNDVRIKSKLCFGDSMSPMCDTNRAHMNPIFMLSIKCPEVRQLSLCPPLRRLTIVQDFLCNSNKHE